MDRVTFVPTPITSVAPGGSLPSNFASTTRLLPRSTCVSPGVTETLSNTAFAAARSAATPMLFVRNPISAATKNAKAARCETCASASFRTGKASVQPRFRPCTTASAMTRCWRKLNWPSASGFCSNAASKAVFNSGCCCSICSASQCESAFAESVAKPIHSAAANATTPTSGTPTRYSTPNAPSAMASKPASAQQIASPRQSCIRR